VPDVRRGDVISTSPVSQLFPPGLPLGRVESVNLDKSPAPEAVIELTAPVSYLEWVIALSEQSVSRCLDEERLIIISEYVSTTNDYCYSQFSTGSLMYHLLVSLVRFCLS
jgi:cell shape-determining protein MreC